MCKECGKYECPPACPNYLSPFVAGGKRCAWCEEFYEARELLYVGGKPYCAECISEMTVGEIIRISEIEDIKRFVDLIEGRLVRCI